VNKKFILDATCSGRMMWFDKNHPAALFMDIRKEEKGFIEQRANFEINPDVIADFRNMPFPDKNFKLVVFDPPHIQFRGYKSWASQKYGWLDPETWKDDIQKGLNECWRVLEDEGVLIFKWSTERDTRSVKVKEIRQIIEESKWGKQGLIVGHPTGKNGNTIWMSLMKFPYDCMNCEDQGCEECALDELNEQDGPE